MYVSVGSIFCFIMLLKFITVAPRVCAHTVQYIAVLEPTSNEACGTWYIHETEVNTLMKFIHGCYITTFPWVRARILQYIRTQELRANTTCAKSVWYVR